MLLSASLSVSLNVAPAARLCPPPPNAAQKSATSKSFEDRQDTFQVRAAVSFAKPGPIAGSRYTPEEMQEIRFLPYSEELRRKDVWKVWGVSSEAKPAK